MRPLEEELGGGYSGLYAEVVTGDVYRLRGVAFQPDVVFDIGANVGVFSRFARTLFPDSLIVAVEPHLENCRIFLEHTNDPRIILLNMALGNGQLYHGTTARNGSGEVYLSAGLGYPRGKMEEAVRLGAGLEHCDVKWVTLPELFQRYVFGRVLMKIDCEGAENCLWQDDSSMNVLRQVDYLAMEIHTYAQDGAEWVHVKREEEGALSSLERGHFCERCGVHFWATKKS